MGVLQDLFESRFHPKSDPPDWVVSLSGWDTATGTKVSPQNSLQVVAVLACVRVLAESLASLPLPVYRRLPSGGKERARDHYLYELLHDAPNPELTSFEVREALQGHLTTWGNAFADLDINGAGRVTGMWPLRPDRMRITRNEVTRELEYIYRLPNKVGAREVVLPKRFIFHLRGLSFDGIVGYSPIQLARQAVGLAMATEEFGARFFGNNATPGFVLTHPQQLSAEAHKRLQKDWETRHQGLEQSHRVAILEEGLKPETIGIPPDDAQFLSTRQFQVTEIARLFRVPPHMIADLERATFSNIEHQSIDFVVHSLRPWLVRWEQALRRDVFTPAERRQFFAEFLVDGLLRGDRQSRFASYGVARQWGWLSADEIRELENQNPLPDGKGSSYLIPLNMVPVAGGQLRERPLLEPRGGLNRPALRELRSRPANSASTSSELRQVAVRQRVMAAHRQLFHEAGMRIIAREVEELREGALQAFGERGLPDFSGWLDGFYQEHRKKLIDEILPPLSVYAQAIAQAAAEEAGQKPDPEGEPSPELQRFVQSYAESFAVRHASSSVGQMRQISQQAVAAGDDPVEAIEERLEDWELTGPDKLADWETNQAGNAVARLIFLGLGATIFRWITVGDSCPYCQSLNGRVVGRDVPFLPAGADFQPEGAEGPLRPSTNTFHPPAHGGCDCLLGIG